MARYVFGDIHGCSKALRALIQEIRPTSRDELIFLGDYIDRGPDSRDVIEQVIRLQMRSHVVPLRGNHELMLLSVAMCNSDPEVWIRCGGHATIASYGGAISKIPERHLSFMLSLKSHYETDSEIFVHAMYDPLKSIVLQDDALTYWTHLPDPLPPPHESGKRVYLGHTPQPGGEVLALPHLVCLDTYCFGGGFLTAMNLDDGMLIQANRHGHIRRLPIQRLMVGLAICAQWATRRFRKPPEEIS